MLLDRPVIDEVPVFGLREYVLFPATLAALQVYDQGLTLLVDDAAAGDRLIVVTGIAPVDGGPEEPPALYEVGGLAKLLNVQREDDGSRLVYMHGLERVRLLRFRREVPYPTAQTQVVPDVEAGRERLHLRRLMRRLHNFLDALMAACGPQRRELAQIVASSQDPAVLSYRLAAVLLRDPLERQRFLEEPSPFVRIQQIIDTVSGMVMGETGPERASAAGLN